LGRGSLGESITQDVRKLGGGERGTEIFNFRLSVTQYKLGFASLYLGALYYETLYTSVCNIRAESLKAWGWGEGEGEGGKLGSLGGKLGSLEGKLLPYLPTHTLDRTLLLK